MNGKMKSKFNVTVELFQVLGQFFETVSVVLIPRKQSQSKVLVR